MNNVRELFPGTTEAASDDIDLRPVLGEIARKWQRIHPLDLTAPEALRLLRLLTEVTDRLEGNE